MHFREGVCVNRSVYEYSRTGCTDTLCERLRRVTTIQNESWSVLFAEGVTTWTTFLFNQHVSMNVLFKVMICSLMIRLNISMFGHLFTAAFFYLSAISVVTICEDQWGECFSSLPQVNAAPPGDWNKDFKYVKYLLRKTNEMFRYTDEWNRVNVVLFVSWVLEWELLSE